MIQTMASQILLTTLASIVIVAAYYYLGPRKLKNQDSQTLNGKTKQASKNKNTTNSKSKSNEEDQSSISPKEYRSFKLIERKEVNHNTRFFRFSLKNSTSVLGLPIGQHLLFRFKHDNGEIVEREYTPVSSDNDKGHFDLVIKIYEKGQMTQFLENMDIGQYLDVRGPRGTLIYDSPGRFKFPYSKQKFRYVKHIGMIAGGTGITPMLQILRQIERDENDSTHCSLIFGNVSENDILLYDELKKIRMENSNIDIYFVIDRLSDKNVEWKEGLGFINVKIIHENLPKPNSEDTLVLVCGPPKMVEVMKSNLTSPQLNYSNRDIFCF